MIASLPGTKTSLSTAKICIKWFGLLSVIQKCENLLDAEENEDALLFISQELAPFVMGLSSLRLLFVVDAADCGS